jgi:IS5 family transposase
VPTSEKIYSIFEPHTDLIKRGKVRTPVEFGHKVFLAESARGLITQYEVLKDNPVDEIHVAPSSRRHRRVFRPQHSMAPIAASSARATSPSARVAASPWSRSHSAAAGKRRNAKLANDRRPSSKASAFRAGIEGRISVLMRGRGMKRCRAEGAERFALFVGAAVLANNLIIIGELLTKRSRCRRQTKRQFSTSNTVEQTAVLTATLSRTAPRRGQSVPKTAREALANSLPR